MSEAILSAASRFALISAPVRAEKLGNGHINATYLVQCEDGSQYVLQRINDRVFTDVDTLMNNIFAVTSYLNGREPGSSLRFVRTNDGEKYLRCEAGCFRAYEYVPGLCLEKALTPAQLETCGTAFGRFQNALADFDASVLGETIPRFHDTENRLKKLEEAAEADPLGRLKTAKAEYEFYMERRGEAGSMLSMQAAGALKTRVTHNDTKLNNVILDPDTLEPRCVIDLDTVMPGLAGNDFGDCIRSGATTGKEDEPDVSLIYVDTALYRAFARGFLGACGASLSEKEIRTLPMGAKLMTYECGARFLTDYLCGDVYFHTDYPQHNLVRCRTQMKLVADSENIWNELNDIIREEAGL